ncbi:hypothetical protein R6Z07M_000504 [Ovis aries]
MARGGLGAPAGPRLPPPRAGGGARPHFPAQPTPRGKEAGGEAFLEKLKGSPSGQRASEARHQTPTSGKNQRSRNRVSPPFRWGGGRREEGARVAGSRREAVAGRHGPLTGPTPRPRRPPLKLPKAERSSGTEASARPGPLAARVPQPARSQPQPPLGPRRRGAGRRRRGGACRLRRGSTGTIPGPCPGEARTNLGGQPGQLWPPSPGLGGGGRWRHHLRRAATAAPGRAGAAEARGALHPAPAAPPAAATSKRGGGAGAPRAAAAAATGAAAHDSVTGGIRQSVTWTPGPCRRCSFGTNRSRRAPPLARPQPMGAGPGLHVMASSLPPRLSVAVTLESCGISNYESGCVV